MGSDQAQTVWMPRPPNVLSGRYELLEGVGRGGMGVVFRAMDRSLDLVVAVKVLDPVLARNRTAIVRLKDEARVAHRLGHPNIVQLRNFEEDGDVKFLVMEFISGPSLRQMLRESGRLSVDALLGLAEGMCAGLDYAHSQRVIHCDVKPENFLLAPDGTVKVADFGLARVARDALGGASRELGGGTLAYMSPEQKKGGKLGRASDIYSLGLTLFELLAGHARRGTGWREQFGRDGVVPDLPDAPEGLLDALRRAMRPEPAERWPCASDLLRALRSAVRGPAHATAGPLAALFGREAELASLEAMVRREGRRLVTVTGAGGSGKTRLAQELCVRLHATFAGAVWFVPLEDVDEPQKIADAVAARMGLSSRGGRSPLSLVTEALSAGQSVLVLDNFEHLVEGGAPVVRLLLEGAPELACVVTSREPLRLTGERCLELAPLPVPEPDAEPQVVKENPSVRLFVDRAQALRPEFALTGSNANAVAELCRRLEGLPLALELAAARIQALSPAEMASGLQHPLDFLVDRRRDVSERHRTLRAAVDWSFRLLSQAQQRFFAGLGVFRGGWTAEAAQAVCRSDEAVDHLAHLRECSLVVAHEAAGSVRFRMRDVLRAYAEELLNPAESEALRSRHADYYTALAEQMDSAGGGRQAVLRALDDERENLRAALEWTLDSDAGVGESLRLSAALGGYWLERGSWQEGREALARVLARAELNERTPVRARVLSHAAGLASSQGDYEHARRQFAEALDICRELGDARQIAALAGYLGNVHWRLGDCAAARPLHEEALGICRELGEVRGVSTALHNLGLAAAGEQDYVRAQHIFTQSLKIRDMLGDRRGMAESLNDLGLCALELGDCATARQHLQTSLDIRRDFGQRDEVAIALHNLGALCNRCGDPERARWHFRESLIYSRELGHRALIMQSLAGMAEALKAGPKAIEAAELLGAADALRDEMGDAGEPTAESRLAAEHDDLRAILGEDIFAAAWQKGRMLPLGEAVDLALDMFEG